MTLPRRPYHHGNLRADLLDAAVALAREGGPDAVVVREASRRVGVSHNAAYRHFPDRDSLLRAVCGRCMAALASLIEQRVGEVTSGRATAAGERARLEATGSAYVEFALSEPGWFRTAFAVPPGMEYLEPGEGVGERGLGPFELLGERLDALVAAGGMPAERRPFADIAAWSAVHGLSTLLIDGPLRTMPAQARRLALENVVTTVTRGFTAP